MYLFLCLLLEFCEEVPEYGIATDEVNHPDKVSGIVEAESVVVGNDGAVDKVGWQ